MMIAPLFVALLAMPGGPVEAAESRPSPYPDTRREELVETFHGQEVADPYRWLEQDPRQSQEVSDWIDAQNAVTDRYLASLDERGAIEERLRELWNYEKYGSPFKKGGRYYYFLNDGLQNHSVLYTVDTLEGDPRVVLDPNGWSEDGTTALAAMSFSDDGRYMAYARSRAGSDWQEWSIRDLESGEDLADLLRWTKFSGASWTHDGAGFFYSRFDAPPEGQEFKALNTAQRVFYHRVGTEQSDDVLVYERPEQPTWGYSTSVTEDGRYLVIQIWEGTDPRNRVLVRDLKERFAHPTTLIDHDRNEFSLVGNDGSQLYFRTDLDAPNGRVIAIDLDRPEPEHYREVIPETKHPLVAVSQIGGRFVVEYLEDVTSTVKVFDGDGRFLRDVDLPGKGSVGGFAGKREDTETFYTYTSFNRPPTIYRYDLASGKSTLWREPKILFDPEAFQVRQVFYESKDGTRVPMFLVHRKDVKPDGKRPTLLYGYGGFNISLTPGFSVSRLAWIERGGVYAVAGLRGGGEYGKAWHDAGKLHHKQNVFDDFIAAAEWLIDHGYTSSDRLGIQGGSNGGLLVGACMVQRPDLFGAALPAVGVMDMLRYHRFTAGRYWVDDYGSVDDPEMFRTLLAYSPYHNLKPGTAYPPTMITTADTDDRVIPAHSFKFAAALQHAHRGPDPVLIRVERAAGHGAGKPTSKAIEEVADWLAFLVDQLEDEPTP